MASRALLPLAFIALLTFWAGTFTGAATARGALAHHAAALAFCLLAALPGAARAAWDPLALGRRWAWVPVALLAVVIASAWASPVPRAGRVALLLLPAYLLLPAAAASCWASDRARRIAASGFSTVVLAVALVALVEWQRLGSVRAALPLGHHTLLGAWLVLVLPLAVVPVRRRGAERWLAAAAGILALSALAAGRSLLAAAGLGAQLLALGLAVPKLRRWAPLAVLPLVPFLPRLARLLFGFDPSAVARVAYLEAGASGAAARPWIGWGPGSTPWTIAEWMRPIAGRNPPSEVIGDLHSLPAQLLYELGAVGLAVAVATAVLFAGRRIGERRGGSGARGSSERADEGFAALLGLLGFAVVSLGLAPLAVPAVSATLAAVAGMAIAAGEKRETAAAGQERRRLGAAVTLGLLYVLPAAALLAPLDRAHLSYDRAVRAAQHGGAGSGDAAAALAHLERARALDPEFPLYRARWAWLAAEASAPKRVAPRPEGIAAEPAEAAAEALAAARSAKGLAPLWLGAGEVAAAAGDPSAAEAFARAHRLDPLSPLAAFHALRGATLRGATLFGKMDAIGLGVRAVSADRRLAYALWWREHPDLALRVAETAGVPIPLAPQPGEERYRLGLTLDRVPALSFSLYAFRRSPWIWTLAPVEIALPPQDRG